MFSLKHLVLQEKTFGAKSYSTDAFPQVNSILKFFYFLLNEKQSKIWDPPVSQEQHLSLWKITILKKLDKV